MMTRTATLIVAVVLVASSACFAADFVNVDVNAEVPAILELSSWIKYFMDDSTTPLGDADSFDFGTLTHTLANGDEAGVWFSRKWFTIYLLPATGSDRYQITQTCTGVTSGGENINSAFVVTPNYSEEDLVGDTPNGTMPGTLGDRGLAVATDKVIYTSDLAGESKVIQGIYALENYNTDVTGFDPISFDQPQGIYGGEVTFTVAPY